MARDEPTWCIMRSRWALRSRGNATALSGSTEGIIKSQTDWSGTQLCCIKLKRSCKLHACILYQPLAKSSSISLALARAKYMASICADVEGAISSIFQSEGVLIATYKSDEMSVQKAQLRITSLHTVVICDAGISKVSPPGIFKSRPDSNILASISFGRLPMWAIRFFAVAYFAFKCDSDQSIDSSRRRSVNLVDCRE